MRVSRAGRAVTVFVGVFGVMVGLALGQVSELTSNRTEGYVAPPKSLVLRDGHWTPYEAPQPPEGSQVHVVAAGDCLWDLAVQYYQDPYLWPTIWDANRYVTYSHWIYPGDPLVIPPKPNLVAQAETPQPGETPAAVVADNSEEQPIGELIRRAPTAPNRAPRPTGPMLVPAAEQEELACAGQLYENFDPNPLQISGREAEAKEMQGELDIVYLSAGRDMGIDPGASFTVLRSNGKVRHPATRKSAGIYVQRVGRVRVIAVQQHSATAEITLSCDGIQLGDYLVPYKELPVPMVERTSLASFGSLDSGRLSGTVVVAIDPEGTIAGTGDLVSIDLGSRAGLTAGDRVFFWRESEGTESRYVNAHGVVLTTNSGGSTVKLLETRGEVRVGDQAEVR